MNRLIRAWRRFFKRHAEAIFIVAFIFIDCFVRHPASTIIAAAAILWVFAPAVRSLITLPPAGRLTFVKAFFKTAKVQRLFVLLFWFFSMDFLVGAAMDANLFTLSDPNYYNHKPAFLTSPTISNALILAAQQWAPIAYLGTPVLVYATACLLAIALRSRLKADKNDPDLILQRQKWSGASQVIFMTAFVGSILSITLNINGPAYMLSNWFIASARDANLYCDDPVLTSLNVETGKDNSNDKDANHEPNAFDSDVRLTEQEGKTDYVNPGGSSTTSTGSPAPKNGTVADEHMVADYPIVAANPVVVADPAVPMLQGVEPHCGDMKFVGYFDAFILSSTSLVAFLLLLQPILRLNALLASFCWRVVSLRSLQNIVEGFLQALRLPSRTLNFREAYPEWNNVGRTLIWLLICYLSLFWLFGFCGGPIGYAIQNWMIASAADAGIFPAEHAPDWVFQPELRIFLGSIVALYGTGPIAVTAATFLPFAKPRKIIANSDGLLFAQGPFVSMWGRQFRLWSDLKSLTVQRDNKASSKVKAVFVIKFRSGGYVKFNNLQVSAQDMQVLLEGIDEHSISCSVAPEVYEICEALLEEERDKAASDGVTDTAIAATSAQEFKSTVFVPFKAGELIPSSQIRVIKQLSSKPLCAVYLGRNEDGRMVTVKQFYLHDETEETKALEKILRREYELLTRLDHPGIAKVLNSFSVDKSTYLVIEHRVGVDLRETVQEHGARPEGLTIAWAKQICEIMIHLHSREPVVIHRDLTPDNIIAGEDGQLRLIDFGAAREFLDGITGTMIGKHCYVAPEQLRGEANQKSDVYSFGCTLFYLLTGRDPVALSQSSPARNMECTDELDQLIRDCTEFEQENRPTSFIEILNRLNIMNKGISIKLRSQKVEAVV